MSETKITKRERNEKLTNRYMVQLTWGIVGILIFILVYRACLKPSTLVMVQPFAWVMTAVFPISAIVLTFLGKSGVIKNKSRAYNYAIFTGVCTFFALWLALFNKLRMVLESLARTILNNPNIMVSSYWNVRIPIILIVAYLVISFIVFAIKVTRK